MFKLPLWALMLLLTSAFVCSAQQVTSEYLVPTNGSGPNQITLGPDGNLWFTESQHAAFPKIGKITTSGVITEYQLPTADAMPTGITAGPDGNLWFTERLGQKIGRITPSGVITEFNMPAAGRPNGITAGPDKHLWFAEENGNKIGNITTTGLITEFVLPNPCFIPSSCSTGITAGPDGNLWFIEQSVGKIAKATTAGVIINEYPIPTPNSGASFMALGADGNLWFTEATSNKIGRISIGGMITEYPIPTANSEPLGIALGPDGNMWFAEQNSNKIGIITPTGSITEFTIPTPVSLPQDVALGPDGKMWFTEFNGNKIGTALPSCTGGGSISISLLSTDHGGNSGQITLQIFGCGFQTSAAVKLSGLGPDIVGTNTTVVNPSVMTMTFDLRGALPGPRDVVLTNPDSTSVIVRAAFTVEQGGAPQVSVGIIGRDKIRIGTPQTFYLQVTNNGNVDALGVPIWLQVPGNVELSIGFNLTQAPLLAGPTVSGAQSGTTIPYQVTVSNSTIAGFYKPYVPAGSTHVLPITLAVNSAIAPFDLNAWVFPPYLASATGKFVVTDPTDAVKCTVDLASLILTGGFGAGGVLLDSLANLVNFSVDTPNLADLQMSTWQTFADIARDDGLPVFDAKGLTEFSAFGTALGIVGALKDCGPLAKILFKMITEQPVTSLDPNVKIGSQGVGSAAYVAASAPLGYSVYFDNQPTATAPAQAVTITDTLNANLDLSTVTLGSITFPNQIVTPPSIPLSVSPFTTTVDLRPNTNLMVKINASLNSTTGALIWTFQSLDPATGLPPTDPLAGFLPPGGEGSVLFTVLPKSTVTTGTVIQNTATVVFDVNPPINTPTWFNTVDNTRPVSMVSALPQTETAYSFPVQWSGTDVGVGVQDFTIYISDNNAPFMAWLTNTTATQAMYPGTGGHTYSFYSIARDLVGNVEAGKTNADATTQIVIDTTPPVIVPQIAGTLGNNGWYRSNVVVSWSVTDPESGIASSSGCNTTTLTADTAGVTVTCSAINGAGLPASVSVTIKIDRTPPVISGMPAAGCSLWPPNQELVTVATVTAADALSGLDPASFKVRGTSNEPVPPTDPMYPDIVITPSATGAYTIQLRADRLGSGTGRVYSLTATAMDLAGNTATVNATCTVPHDQEQN
jgi:streptogramin lyase